MRTSIVHTRQGLSRRRIGGNGDGALGRRGARQSVALIGPLGNFGTGRHNLFERSHEEVRPDGLPHGFVLENGILPRPHAHQYWWPGEAIVGAGAVRMPIRRAMAQDEEQSVRILPSQSAVMKWTVGSIVWPASGLTVLVITRFLR